MFVANEANRLSMQVKISIRFHCAEKTYFELNRLYDNVKQTICKGGQILTTLFSTKMRGDEIVTRTSTYLSHSIRFLSLFPSLL